MELAELGEFGLIGVFRRMLEEGGEGVRMGLGDDAAILDTGGDSLLAFTADMLLEEIHFDLDLTDAFSLGYKSLTVNLSDLAAMGGRSPAWAVLSVGIPSGLSLETIEELYRGLKQAADRYGCSLVGGDTVRSPDRLVINVALLGTVEKKGLLTRAGGRPGNVLMLTGEVGASALGLAALQKGRGARKKYSRYVEKHLRPEPRLDLSATLASRGVTAAIDISDGLLQDLEHICEESRVGAALEIERIPFPRDAREAAAALGVDFLPLALGGGEDYELLLAVEAERAEELEKAGAARAIGLLEEGTDIRVLDAGGGEMDIASTGWDHFRGGEV
jgi:thiamine-monophosphate kinase